MELTFTTPEGVKFTIDHSEICVIGENNIDGIEHTHIKTLDNRKIMVQEDWLTISKMVKKANGHVESKWVRRDGR